MKPKYKKADVVYLMGDREKENRIQYKIIEFYTGTSDDNASSSSRGDEGRSADLGYRYLIEPLTDGAGRLVDEHEIEKLVV